MRNSSRESTIREFLFVFMISRSDIVFRDTFVSVGVCGERRWGRGYFRGLLGF